MGQRFHFDAAGRGAGRHARGSNEKHRGVGDDRGEDWGSGTHEGAIRIFANNDPQHGPDATVALDAIATAMVETLGAAPPAKKRKN